MKTKRPMRRWVLFLVAIGFFNAYMDATSGTDAIDSPKARIDDIEQKEKDDIPILDEEPAEDADTPAPEIIDSDAITDVDLFPPEERGFRLSAGIGVLRGDSTFEIGGNFVLADGASGRIHFPLSKLEFPLDVVIGSVETTIDFDERWTFRGALSKNVTSDSGKTKDSDWGVHYLAGVPSFGPRTLDIYSECDTDLDLIIGDIALQYRVFVEEKWSLSFAAGYLYQEFEFEMSNLREEYPSLRGLLRPVFVSGKAGEYDVTYQVPYLQGVLNIRPSETIMIEGGLAYSPIAKARDEGNWILRSRTFRSRADGDFYRVYVNARVDLKDNWFLAGLLERVSISTSGTMTQYDFGELFSSIDSRIKSEQTRAVLFIGRLF